MKHWSELAPLVGMPHHHVALHFTLRVTNGAITAFYANVVYRYSRRVPGKNEGRPQRTRSATRRTIPFGAVSRCT